MDLTTLCCQAPKNYSEEYDAYYCGPCNVWAEDTCDDPTCEFCTNRPTVPVNETGA